MSPVTDEQVVARLGSFGLPLENFFVFPGDSEIGGLIGFWHSEVGFRYLILEDDELAKACYIYLTNRGARQFNTTEELNQAIATEKWPGWDTCDEVARARRLSGGT